MVKEYHFKVAKRESVSNELILDYFCHQGFVVEVEEMNKLFFTRKQNIISRIISANPLRWNSQIMVLRKGKEIFIHANISSLTNLVSKRAERAWEQFFLNFEYVINSEAGLVSRISRGSQ